MHQLIFTLATLFALSCFGDEKRPPIPPQVAGEHEWMHTGGTPSFENLGPLYPGGPAGQFMESGGPGMPHIQVGTSYTYEGVVVTGTQNGEVTIHPCADPVAESTSEDEDQE